MNSSSMFLTVTQAKYCSKYQYPLHQCFDQAVALCCHLVRFFFFFGGGGQVMKCKYSAIQSYCFFKPEPVLSFVVVLKSPKQCTSFLKTKIATKYYIYYGIMKHVQLTKHWHVCVI